MVSGFSDLVAAKDSVREVLHLGVEVEVWEVDADAAEMEAVETSTDLVAAAAAAFLVEAFPGLSFFSGFFSLGGFR